MSAAYFIRGPCFSPICHCIVLGVAPVFIVLKQCVNGEFIGSDLLLTALNSDKLVSEVFLISKHQYLGR